MTFTPTPAAVRMRRILQNPEQFISPVPLFLLVDYQAMTGGHWAIVQNEARASRTSVIRFTEAQTGLLGWEIERTTIQEGKYRWLLKRNK